MAASMINLGGDATWPIVSATYILLPKDPKDAAASMNVMKFFDWAFTNGGPTAAKLHYIMLPQAVMDNVRKAWAVVKGPDGAAIWGM
jgi:phosphate transport system substrate-binding protein